MVWGFIIPLAMSRTAVNFWYRLYDSAQSNRDGTAAWGVVVRDGTADWCVLIEMTRLLGVCVIEMARLLGVCMLNRYGTPTHTH